MLEPVNFSYVYLHTFGRMLLPKQCAKKITSFTSLHTSPTNSLFLLPHLLCTQSCITSEGSRVLADNKESFPSFTYSKFSPTASLGEPFTRFHF